jgi:hypothetical protein
VALMRESRANPLSLAVPNGFDDWRMIEVWRGTGVECGENVHRMQRIAR